MNIIKSTVKKTLSALGYELIKGRSYAYEFYPDTPDLDRTVITRCQPFTMTSVRNLEAVTRSMRHIARHEVAGDVAECGVWRGGSIMTAASMLSALGDAQRRFWLFDTFEGMTEPGANDPSIVHKLFREEKNWCAASLPEVRGNISAHCDADIQSFRFIQGKVEDTLQNPANLPDRIAFLRLDTDWYDSTKAEMNILYPRVAKGGIVMIDDYGAWSGSRKAVDEYLAEHNIHPYLHSVDYTCRLFIKEH